MHHEKDHAFHQSLLNESLPIQKTVIQENQSVWDGFDVDDLRYPEELDIALQAWRAVSNNPSNAPIKEQLTDWLKQSGYPLSTAANERITTLCNWDKSGGRPKSN
ncbi:MAG: hypothetical protein A3I66_12670 [Burkholderiales bacterium RIFCSPLOWO2_02_FULL_57_36]|nr:MAG: hypothetical protein A3I66_12670 [Burkholderiales bacterium RIFCSPLOWO2_02_FULL_57_36]